jgi:hypothetical protein
MTLHGLALWVVLMAILNGIALYYVLVSITANLRRLQARFDQVDERIMLAGNRLPDLNAMATAKLIAEYDFHSASEARTANCHGVFEDKSKYAIAKYRVTYELIESDVDD